jgi:hypothetical protein
MDGVQTEVRTEVVNFVEDGQVDSKSTPPMADDFYLRAARDSLSNTNLDFLSRPVPVSSFEWTSGVLANHVYVNQAYPSNLLARPMISEKTKGFRYFRGGIKFRLQVNAPPFAAGRLIMAWFPFQASMDEIPSSQIHLGGITGYRHVDLDLGTGTACELEVPYMSPLTHTDLVTGFGEMGSLKVIVYSPLTGVTSVEATVWAHFVDPQLEMPTGMKLRNFIPSALRAQSRLPAVAEAKAGDLQTMFDAQTRILGKLGSIPVLREVSSGLSWFTQAASGVAAIFGWSKPSSTEFDSSVTRRICRNYTNFAGQHLTKPMGFDARNSIIRPQKTFGTDDDEMAISTIVQKPIYMNNFPWNVSDVPGTIIFRWPIHPAACKSFISGTSVTRHNTYLSFISDLFSFWRGAINYHFKFIKTNFHSGRLRYFIVPGARPGDDLADVDIDKCYSQIVDIRETPEFDFSVPFISNRMFEDIHAKRNIDEGFFGRGIPTAMLYVEVLNSLRKTGEAADAIDVIIETSGGSDMQFGFPLLDRNIQVQTGPLPARVLTPQSKDFFPSANLDGYLPNAASLGEVVTSLRQVLKRYTRVKMGSTPVGIANTVLYPYTTQYADPTIKDVYSYISNIYRCQSGGLRLFLALSSEQGQDTVPHTFALEPFSHTRDPGTWTSSESEAILETTGGSFTKFFNTEGNIEIDIPWYQPAPFLPTEVGKIPTWDYDNTSSSRVPMNAGTRLQLGTATYEVSRSIAEDFTFGYLIGAPLSVYTNNA